MHEAKRKKVNCRQAGTKKRENVEAINQSNNFFFQYYIIATTTILQQQQFAAVVWQYEGLLLARHCNINNLAHSVSYDSN
jgi:hypothetical protein